MMKSAIRPIKQVLTDDVVDIFPSACLFVGLYFQEFSWAFLCSGSPAWHFAVETQEKYHPAIMTIYGISVADQAYRQHTDIQRLKSFRYSCHMNRQKAAGYYFFIIGAGSGWIGRGRTGNINTIIEHLVLLLLL